MRRGEVRANGVRYAYLEEGTGPLVLLLHGYPDNAHSWEHQLGALAAAGYRAVAPFMRGYPPTEVPPGAFYDRATLACDVAGLVDALGGGEPCHLVGQDWGAAIGYGVLGAFPERIRRAVILAVPHPVAIRRTLRRSPAQVIRSFHWFLFQLPWLPERLVRARKAAFLEFLWWLWSPAYQDRAHVAAIRETMAAPEVAAATLAYYRAAMQSSFQDPALGDVRERLDRPIEVPTRVLCGAKDMRGRMLEGQRDLFRADYDWQIVEGAGHFLHRERPAEVNRHILDWLAPA
ncbi:MAG TPA: alpha/beta fold hydrolase [Kofleriaceae bacterium]|nr:alpha/beta fold hydrolase [Kofleriaceae bacterium]